MSERPTTPSRPDPRGAVERDVARLRRREGQRSVFWRSMSVLGTVGWSIALPAAAGAWFGHRIDLRLGTGVRFTLMLLTAGVALGSFVAWRVIHGHRE